jgi:hypothetical protein
MVTRRSVNLIRRRQRDWIGMDHAVFGQTTAVDREKGGLRAGFREYNRASGEGECIYCVFLSRLSALSFVLSN